MPSKPKPKQLIVEGKNDQHVIWALCLRHNLPDNFSVEVVPEGGVDALLDGIPVRLKGSGIQTLGIVVDADVAAQSRWDAIMSRLRASDYTDLPHTPDPHGSIIMQQDKPTVGIWIMPNNTIPGILEDFVAQLIPQDDQLRPKVEHALTEIEASRIHRYPIVARPKAFIHTWLAWQETPGQPMGLAITANTLRHNNELALAFVAWLSKLFGG